MVEEVLKQYQDTTATKKLFKLKKKIRAISGGTGASKTISILIWLIDYGQNTKNKIVTVVGESVPHLNLGAKRDFKSIMVANGYWKENQWAESGIYTFPNGTIIEFISFDKFGKAHGPRRNVLFLNEANYLPYNIVDQLITRTREVVWIDWNPSEDFWFYTEMLHKRNDIEFVGDYGDYPPLTYLDNEGLDESQKSEIEAHRSNAQWWKVYGEGKKGELEGKIYSEWKLDVEEIPHEARLERYGLDFGYTNDPTAIVGVYKYNGGYILDEVAFNRGLQNNQIASLLLNETRAPVVADSAEPKSIDELKSYGLTIIPSKKGKDSVRNGIQLVQQQRISVTKRSVNLIKEYRNYLWMTDKDGKILNEPEHTFSHSMDACLVGETLVTTDNGDKQIKLIEVGDYVLTRDGFRKVTSAGQTGHNKKLWILKTKTGHAVIGTGNHPILTERGWLNLCDIRYDDKVYLCKQKLPTKVKTILSTRKQNNYTGGNTFMELMVSYIDMFLETILVKFQMVCTFTTRIMTLSTTDRKTWNFSPTLSMESFTGQKKSFLRSPVNNVQFSLRVLDEEPTASAQTNVRVNGEGQTNQTLSGESVFSARNLFKRTNTNMPRIVPISVQSVIDMGKRADVYNLEVEGTHEYFAGGILVHNCRYALSSMLDLIPDQVRQTQDNNFAINMARQVMNSTK